MKFHPEKCVVLRIGKHKATDFQYSLSGHQLQEKSVVKDLGILVDNQLKFHSQVQQAVSDARKMFFILKSVFKTWTIENTRKLYVTFIRPKLEYCVHAWSPHYIGDVNKMERVQRAVTRQCSSLKSLPYEERLKRLNLTSLTSRRLRGDLIKTRQILSGEVILPVNHFFEQSTVTRTRGHSMKLKKPRVRTIVGQSCFTVRAINAWNALPHEIMTAPSISSWKRQYDLM